MSQPLESLLIGRILADRYLIEERIGRGGMSIVYRAIDQRLGRPVALKIVSLPAEELSDREHLRERLRREAASAARIPPHPNVVQVYDYGTDSELDLDFIAMELLRGEDLKSVLRGGRPERDRAVRIVADAGRGLAAGHRSGIVHRDVKPANIFLSTDHGGEVVKILDFGIAKALEITAGDDLTRTGQAPHSPAYASPEQLDPGRVLTPASDVYQLGTVAYEILAGARPFTEAERERLRDGVEVPVPTLGSWGKVPPAIRAIVERALRLDPEERYPDAAAFVQALEEAEDRTEEDGTVLLGGGAVAETREMPDGAGTSHPAAVPTARGPEPPARRTTRSAPALGRKALLAGGAVLGLLLLFLLVGRGGQDGAVDAEETAGVLDVAALDEEFRPLVQRAREALLEQSSPVEGEDAAAAVHQVIADVNQAWVMGDLDRHISHYADRVDFYNARDAPRSLVERDRGAAMERYPQREIVIGRQATEFPEPGVARALVDKSWTFGSDSEVWEGEVRQELILELRDGRWLITAERDLEVFRSERNRD